MGKVTDAILQLISISGEISINDIANATGEPLYKVSRIIKKLDEKGKILIRKVREGKSFISFISLKSENTEKSLEISTCNLSKSEVQVEDFSQESLNSSNTNDKNENDSKLQLASKNAPLQVENIEDLLKEISYTQISMEKYVQYFLDTFQVIPATDTLKVLFPQLADSEITLIVNHYKEQGFPQKQFRGDYRTGNQLIDEGIV